MSSRPQRSLVAVLGALALVIGACSAPPTAEDGTTTTGEPATTAAPGTTAAEEETTTTEATGEGNNLAALEDVYAEVEGLTGEERTARLLELAQEEDTLSIYGSTNLEDALPLFDAFADLYDLEPNYYRASSSDVLQRILQEVDANFPGNGVVMANGPEMAILDGEGLLLPLETPTTDNIIEAGVFPTWAAIYMNSFIAGWNTEFVSGEVPDNWNDFLTTFEGALAIEVGDWDWFATLTRRYFIEELGMTEDEVVELFKTAVAGAKVVDGHTLMAELLVAGEYDASTSLYHHRVTELMSEGAPLEWEPPVRPIIVRPNGVGIMSHVQNPASALLWVEFMLTDGQVLLADEFRGPASTEVEGGIPVEYAPILVDLEAITQEREKWEALWEEIVLAAGTEPIEE
ncbi:MAG: ABC transporter substrate-binding protein [Acidimicrobiia bacterium]